ncbi:RimK/LysX family protein [Haliea sp. E17]|uniref:putative ATP-dependent zinc protease n=1 Tax=Haliea sp. E17 TaxID=3401576 RepID=UPI003AAA7474
MKIARYPLIGLSLLAVSACTTLTTEAPVEGAATCPVPEVLCPVCVEPPEPEVCSTEVVERIVEVPAPLPPMATTAGKLHLPIIGAIENVLVEPAGLLVEARIDTGMETTVLQVEDLKLVEKEGKRYVRFDLVGGDDSRQSQEMPLRRRDTLHLAGGETMQCHVVRMWLSLGEMRSRINVCLSDHAGDGDRLLLGRNFLLDSAIVDVSRHHTQPDPELPSP